MVRKMKVKIRKTVQHRQTKSKREQESKSNDKQGPINRKKIQKLNSSKKLSTEHTEYNDTGNGKRENTRPQYTGD